MPFLAVVIPTIPTEHKEKVLADWPSQKAELKAQPGVLDVLAGPILIEDGAPPTDFKFFQGLLFKSAEDAEVFENSSWAKGRKAEFQVRGGPEPFLARFEVSEPPADAPKPITQFSVLEIDDTSKHAQAREAFEKLANLAGNKGAGGVSAGDGQKAGLGVTGWNNLEEAKAARDDPKFAEASAEIESLGKTHNIFVQTQ
ncbi:hypothetical protein CEP54_016090 [Fusarium duplospermum]|uniref:ABM domain-containing protein n=1 Tax=Fusarium duplospermum TaxID=1325734 RepID=A0A428NIG3_9HYPO|nr:hypothetical protein CEP54_016090 [Fusarium duplospermum]